MTRNGFIIAAKIDRLVRLPKYGARGIVCLDDIDNVAVTYTNNDYGKGLAESFEQAFKEKGGTIAGTETVNENDRDFGAVVTQVNGSNADLVYYGGEYPAAGPLAAQLKERGVGHFSNGWVWLLERGGKLEIGETHDGDTLADQGFNPLLTIDVWEHAYYLDHQNQRPAYLKAVIDNHLNWEFAAENLARGSAISGDVDRIYVVEQNRDAQMLRMLRSGEELRREEHDEAVVRDGDTLEIVRMVGGG